MLSKRGNPEIKSLFTLLHTMGLRLAVEGNITFQDGVHHSKINLIGADCDVNTNILAKANMLIHLSEALRDPQATIETINKLNRQRKRICRRSFSKRRKMYNP